METAILLPEKMQNLQTASEQNSSRKLILNSFFHFFYFAFCVAVKRMEGFYIVPDHLKDMTGRVQFCKRTSTIAPRYHLKSTLIEAYILWKLLRCEHRYNSWMYFSYTGDLAAHHTKIIKIYISLLPELFGKYQDLTQSESILHYCNPEGRYFHCEPVGILTFQRGKHPHGIVCDDILRDPKVKLDITQLEKLNTTFFEEIEPMPKEELHCVGTPQHSEDLLSKLELKEDYNCKRYDAEVDSEKQISWWPGMFPWAELKKREKRYGQKAYKKEFRCRPQHGVEGYVDYDQLTALINLGLRNYPIGNADFKNDHPNAQCFGGLDIGKKTHPSHLWIGREEGDRIIQVHSKFMDGWDYVAQIEYCQTVIETFNINKLHYDDTRAEFEIKKELGQLPPQMEGVAFRLSTKFGMATELDTAITNKTIELLADTPEDDRQKRSIAAVDADLKAATTSEGHGDAFFSLCLAIDAWKHRNYTIYDALAGRG